MELKKHNLARQNCFGYSLTSGGKLRLRCMHRPFNCCHITHISDGVDAECRTLYSSGVEVATRSDFDNVHSMFTDSSEDFYYKRFQDLDHVYLMKLQMIGDKSGKRHRFRKGKAGDDERLQLFTKIT
jgi:hypothetical protein